VSLLFVLPEVDMREQNSSLWKGLRRNCVSRRNIIRGAAGAALGASLLRPSAACADDDGDDGRRCRGPILKPIPGGLAPLAPFGVKIHHNPLNPAVALPDISDPSQVNDFDGFVGLTRIQGGGTGTDLTTGETTALAYRTDMGFAVGKLIGIDGLLHKGTFAFV
jgi:hypothetical protein